MKGSPPKRRSVLTVFDWSGEIIADWLERGHPHMTDGLDLFPSERGTLCFRDCVEPPIQPLLRRPGPPPGLDIHSLRRSSITHLIEAGMDPLFVQLIWSPSGGVFDVHHGARMRTIPRDGGGYLKPSVTRDSRRGHAGSRSFGVRFAA
jgi:hypothetical protein